MNILILGWRGPKHPNAGGAEQVVHEHAKGWVKAGHNVTLFTSYFTGAKIEEDVDGIKVIRKSFQYWGVHFAAIFWYIFDKHPKFDLVIDQFHGIPFFTPLYIKIKKIALIQEVAKEVWFANQMPFPINYIIGLIGYLGEPFIFLFYKRVHFMTGSESAKKDLIKYGIDRKNITIVPHGVKLLEKPKIYSKSEPTIISFLGAISKDKGVEDAIKAFGLLDKNKNYKLWIIGKCSKNYKNELSKLVKMLAIEDRVKFWGYVEESQKFDLLKKTHILVNPSIREGWGLVNIEANSVGTPVVSYKSAGLVDSVKDGVSGVIVEKNTPAKIAENIKKLTKDQDLYKKMQEGSINWCKKFDWKKSKILSLNLLVRISK